MTRHPLAPVAALVAAMVSVQCGAALAKGLFPVVGATGTTALRVALSALMLLALRRPWRHPVSAREAGAIALFGAALGCMNLLFYLALRTVPLGVAVAIEFTGPLAVALAASRRPADFAWIGLAVTGLGLLLPLSGADRLDPTGVAYALGAALAWALYILAGQRAARAGGGQAVAFGMLVAALIVTPFGLVEAGTRLLGPDVLAWGLVVAVLSSALPYSLEIVALGRLPARVFGVMMSLEPVIAAVSGLALLGERLGPIQVIAILCVIAASAGVAWGARGPAP